MPTHAEKRKMPYSAQQMFDLVADVERYPEFLPWCNSCRIIRRESDTVFYADLVIGYKVISERFISKVTLEAPNLVHVEYIKGPMKHLSNHWRFISDPDGSCEIDFYVDFAFKNFILQKLMGEFFSEIVRKMIGAFETRAKVLYEAKN